MAIEPTNIQRHLVENYNKLALKGLHDPADEEISLSLEEPSYISVILDNILTSQSDDPEFDPAKHFLSNGHEDYATAIMETHLFYWSRSRSAKFQTLACLSKFLDTCEHRQYLASFLQQLIQKSMHDKEVRYLLSTLTVTMGVSDAQGSIAEQTCRLLEEALQTTDQRSLDILSNALVSLALSTSSGLLGTSICFRAFEYGAFISPSMIHQCLWGLTEDDPSSRHLQLKAIFKFLGICSDFQLSSDLQRRIVELGLKVSGDNYPNIAYETFQNVARSPSEAPIPLATCYKVLILHLYHEATLRASNIWSYVVENYREDQYLLVDSPVLSSLILKMSKYRRTIGGARKIANAVPPEGYTVAGLTESLLTYCSRDQNIELAQKIYDRLVSPFRRSVLSAFLKLHLSFGDVKGGEKIITQIKNQGGRLRQEDILCISDRLEAIGEDKGMEYIMSASKSSRNALHKVIGLLVKRGIDKGQFKYYQQYIDMLLESPSADARRMAYTCVMQKLCFSGEDTMARQYWQKLNLENGKDVKNIVVLNSILDAILHTKKKRIFAWLCGEYRELGISFGEVKEKIIATKSIRDDERETWLSILKVAFGNEW